MRRWLNGPWPWTIVGIVLLNAGFDFDFWPWMAVYVGLLCIIEAEKRR